MPALIRTAIAVLLVPLAPIAARGQKPATDYSQQAFIIEQERSLHRFENDGTGRREQYARIKVQSEAGVQAWGQLALGYNAASERLDIEFVRVHKLDGSVVTAPPDAVQDLTSPVQREAPVYTDFRQKHVTVPGLRPGETLEFRVTVTVYTAIASGQFWTQYDFEKQAIVLDEQFDLDLPAARKVILKTEDGLQPTIKEADGRRVYHWASSHTTVEKEKKDDETTDEDENNEPEQPSVRVTTFQNWEEVGRWYAGLEKPSRAPTDEIRRKAQELVAGKATNLDRIAALYGFVAPNFRYVSLSLGAGRYQPRPAADVLRDQYGDCKDKHTLLASLMESVGLPVSTALINSRVKIDPDFPSPSQFDHAITRAANGNDAVWLDVTTEVAPFRLLSANLRKKQALVIPLSGAAHLEETPADPPIPNTQLVEVDGKLAELGKLSAKVHMSFRGDAELLMRTIFRRTPAAQWETVLSAMAQGFNVKGDVSAVVVSDPAATSTAFQIDFQLANATVIDWTKKKADLKLPLGDVNIPAGNTNRKTPLKLGSPMKSEYRVRLELAPAYAAHAPVPVRIDRDYGSFNATYKVDGSRFVAEKRLEFRQREIPVDRSGDYAAFARVVLADNDQALALDVSDAGTSSVPADLKAGELSQSGYEALRNGNYAQAVTLLKRVVELEPKHKTAWNNLGLAYLGLRKQDEALDAFRKQAEINPYDEYAHNNMARVYFQERKYTEAEAAFKKQLEINPLDKYAHANLGSMYIEAERYVDAVPELERAIALTPDRGDLQVQLGTAYLNVDKIDLAMTAFDKAAQLAPDPLTWNNVSYQLAVKAVRLDRAKEYAESAVAAVTAATRTFTADHAGARELATVASIAAYWDTLGWVHFANGDLAGAEPLIASAWQLSQSSEIGDHLAQIQEKRGRRDEAIRIYAQALAAERPAASTRGRLVKLVGDGRVADLIKQHTADLSQMRTVSVDVSGLTATEAKADFIVLLSSASLPEGVTFVSGDEALRTATAALLKTPFGALIPSGSTAKLLRRGTLSCLGATSARAARCAFTLALPSEAQPVQ